MDITTVTSLISNVGFPIAVSIVCIWYVYKTDNKHTEQIKEITKEHKDEIMQLRESIENNTHVMQALLDHLQR